MSDNNFRKVKGFNIYISNIKDARDINIIKKYNIKTIFGIHEKSEIVKHPNVINFNISVLDPGKGLVPDNPIWEAVEVFKISYENAKSRNGNILVHCIGGSNRSALSVALYLNKYHNIKLQDAVNMTYVKQHQPWMIGLNIMFKPNEYIKE